MGLAVCPLRNFNTTIRKKGRLLSFEENDTLQEGAVRNYLNQSQTQGTVAILSEDETAYGYTSVQNDTMYL